MADDVRSNNICCLSKLWQLRLALLSNVALLVWCHSRYFSTFIGHGKQRKYQNYFQCTKLATCIPGKRLAFNKIMGLEKSNGGQKGNFHTQKNKEKGKWCCQTWLGEVSLKRNDGILLWTSKGSMKNCSPPLLPVVDHRKYR